MKYIHLWVVAALIVAETGDARAAATDTRDSQGFASKFTGNEIWNGAYTNGWSFNSNPALTLNPDNTLTFVNDNSDWLAGSLSTVDGGVTTWSTGNHGDWTLEVRLRFNNLPNGIAFWLGASSDRIIVDVFDALTQDSGGGTFTTAHGPNTNGQYHTYRFANDSVNNRYHVWRNGVELTPGGGVTYDAINDDDRLIIGDRTGGTFADNFDITIDYIRYDQTGAYAPRVVVDNADGATEVTASSATLSGNLLVTSAVPTTATVFWGETDGETVLTDWDNTNALGSVPVGPVSTTVSVTEGTTYFYRLYASNAVETAWALSSARFETPLAQTVTVAVTDHASETGPDSGTFTFTRTSTNRALTVNFTLDGSTAREGRDYAAFGSHVVAFADGASNATLVVNPIADTYILEQTETVVLTLQAGGYSVGSPDAGTMTIDPLADELAWPYVPTNVEGSLLWLDASDMDGDGNADAPTPDSPVALWADKSGQGNQAAQPTVNLQPVIKTDILNGHPAVRFDGTGDRLFSGTTATYKCLHDGSGSTIITVFRSIVPTSSALQWVLDTGGDTYRNVGMAFGIENRGGDTDRLWWSVVRGGGNILNTDSAPYDGIHPLQTWTLGVNTFAYETPGSDLRYYTNAVELVSVEPQSAPPSANNAARTLSIGARGDNGTLALNGDVAEILIYDKVLNSNELDYVGSYLAIKYDLDSDYEAPTTIVGTRPAANVATTSADLNGELLAEDATPTAVTLYWGESDGGDAPSAWGNTNPLGAAAVGPVSVNVSLTPDRRYFYRYAASNASGIVWSDASATFITGEITLQVADADAAENPWDTATITVTRPPALTNEVLRVAVTIGGTADGGTDYAPIASMVEFPLGATDVSVTISPIDDWVLGEGDETVTLQALGDDYVGSPNTALVTITDSAGRARKRSTAFAYRYELNGAHMQNQDLDHEGHNDWSFANALRPVLWPNVPSGTITNGIDLTHSTQPVSSIWNTAAIDGDYTVECRVRAIRQDNTKSYLGALTVWTTPSGPNVDTGLLYIGTNDVYYGQNGANLLGSFDNVSEFHSFRIVRRKPAGGDVQFWIWRDGTLLNPGEQPLPNTFTETQGRDMILLGDTSSSMKGVWELDYVRIENGAWAWARPPAPGTVLIIR